mmetsp:Transcript_20605/g.44889  ORF Transcript_20605/g.44889 Transcript_20605/m.44889 type:complete len:215 (-) Transcript_20605:21-665(-)
MVCCTFFNNISNPLCSFNSHVYIFGWISPARPSWITTSKAALNMVRRHHCFNVHTLMGSTTSVTTYCTGSLSASRESRPRQARPTVTPCTPDLADYPLGRRPVSPKRSQTSPPLPWCQFRAIPRMHKNSGIKRPECSVYVGDCMPKTIAGSLPSCVRLFQVCLVRVNKPPDFSLLPDPSSTRCSTLNTSTRGSPNRPVLGRRRLGSGSVCRGLA